MILFYVIYTRISRYLFLTILQEEKSKIQVSVLGEGLLVSLDDRMQKSQWRQNSKHPSLKRYLTKSWAQWFKSVILATVEMEIWKITFWDQPQADF
jgi:hypothetical protein